MIIEKIDLLGFGRLSNRSFTFSPTLNLIVGPNEAGKSTLLRAIEALLYGHFKDSASWAGDTQRLAFAPWSGGLYAGTIAVKLASGEHYRIERRFNPERTVVFSDPGATDVTERFGARAHGWIDFADRYLGISPAVFRASACIHQDDLRTVKGSIQYGLGGLRLEKDEVSILQSRLETFVDSGGAEQSAQQAINCLTAWERERVNPRAIVVEYSPLRRAKAKVDSLTDQLQASRDALDALAELVAQEQEKASAVTRLDTELADLAGAIAWHEADNVAGKLDALRQVLGEIAKTRQLLDQDADVANLTDLESVQREVDRWDRAAGERRDAVAAREALLDQYRITDTGRDPLLADRDPVLPDELNRLLEAAKIHRARVAAAELQAGQFAADPSLDREYQTLQTQLGELTPVELADLRMTHARVSTDEARLPAGSSTLPIVGALIAAILGFGLGLVTVGPVAGVVGLVVLSAAAYTVLRQLTRPPASTAPSTERVELARRLERYRASSVEELQRAWDRRVELREQLSESMQKRMEVERERADLSKAIDELERCCGQRDLGVAAELLGKLQTWTAQLVRLNQADVAVGLAEQAAKDALNRVGISAESPALAQAALAATRDRRESYREHSHTLELLTQRRDDVLAGAESSQWERQLAEFRERAVSPAPDDGRSLDDLRARVQTCRDERETAKIEQAALAARREERLGEIGEPAEIAEQLAVATDEWTRVRRLGDALAEAGSIIKTVAEEYRRGFAPRLSADVSRWLDRVTQHRYTRADVSPQDLAVRLDSREQGGGLVTLDHVSRGTRDAVALLLRASVVDLLGNAGESIPLFFDDPLVHVDEERARAILAILGEFAPTRQIFYFTQDPRIQLWLAEIDDCAVVSLPGPVMGAAPSDG